MPTKRSATDRAVPTTPEDEVVAHFSVVFAAGRIAGAGAIHADVLHVVPMQRAALRPGWQRHSGRFHAA